MNTIRVRVLFFCPWRDTLVYGRDVIYPVAAGGSMKQLSVLRKIAPEIGELVERRHTVLQSVLFVQPIGRRALGRQAGLAGADGAQGDRFPAGVGAFASATRPGWRSLHGRAGAGRAQRDHPGVSRPHRDRAGAWPSALISSGSIVVPGDSDADETVKKEIARATAEFLRRRMVRATSWR